MNEVDRQLKRIARIFDKDEPPEVNEETLMIFLDHLRRNVELPCILTGSEDFEWEEYYVIGPGSKKEHERLRKTQASYLDAFELIGFDDEVNEDQGILVHVRRTSDKKRFWLPLDYLKTEVKRSKNYRLLDDYAVWFANYR